MKQLMHWTLINSLDLLLSRSPILSSYPSLKSILHSLYEETFVLIRRNYSKSSVVCSVLYYN